MIQHYAESTHTNGLIVALDQEKVYDKISHDYLWKVLDKFKIPTKIINTIKSLYNEAKTSVMINGHMSSAYTVNRGMRQA
jgi:hypothetical protein